MQAEHYMMHMSDESSGKKKQNRKVPERKEYPMNRLMNTAKKILTGFMIVAVAVIMIGTKPAGPRDYNRPKGEDKIGLTKVATIQLTTHP